MRADARAHREAILAAALELFLSSGINVSLRTIARKAGVGIATLLRHFPERIDLISAIQHQSMEQLSALIATAIARWNEDSEAVWNQLIHELVTFGMNGRLGVLFAEVHENSDFAATPEFITARTQIITEAKPLVALAAEAGYLPLNLDVVQFFMGLMVVSRPLGPGVNKLAPDFDQWIVATYLAGLRTQ